MKLIYKTKIGYILIVAKKDAVSEISYIGDSDYVNACTDDVIAWEGASCKAEQTFFKPEEREAYQTAEMAMEEILEYLDGNRKEFTFHIKTEGTVFQEKVWEALREIPYGETRSYGQIAACIGKPKASRAVGMANNRNPVMIATPCHRVIGADGSLTGYACGTDIKKFLLELEKNYK